MIDGGVDPQKQDGIGTWSEGFRIRTSYVHLEGFEIRNMAGFIQSTEPPPSGCNVAANNVVADPVFAGGQGEALMSMLPTGFDAAWHPNSGAFALTSASPPGVLQGDTLPAPFTVDILGRVRTLFSLGAYEQTGVAIQGPPPPTGLRVRR